MAQPIKINEESFKSLSGKTILITGASSGIGLETAEYFYSLGCNVAFIGGRKRPDTKIPLVDNPRTLFSHCDISSWAAVLEVFKLTMAKFGRIDIVCANAGVDEPRNQYFQPKIDAQGEPQELDLRVIDVDLKGTAYTVALGAHYMMKTGGGSIIMVSSMAGYHAVPDLPNYCAAKHASVGLLRSLPPHGTPKNIAISLLAPHITYTPGTFAQQYKPGKEAFEKARAELMSKGMRLSSSYTCALGVAYLAEGGIKMSGESLMVENDEINALESSLHDARPDWFVKKEDNKEAARIYASMMDGK